MRVRSLGVRLLALIVATALIAGILPMAAAGMSPMCPTSPCDTPAFTCCCDAQTPTTPAPSPAATIAMSVFRAGADHPVPATALPDLFATSFVTQRLLVTAASKPPADRLTLLSTLLI